MSEHDVRISLRTTNKTLRCDREEVTNYFDCAEAIAHQPLLCTGTQSSQTSITTNISTVIARKNSLFGIVIE